MQKRLLPLLAMMLSNNFLITAAAGAGAGGPFEITAKEEKGKAVISIVGYIHEWADASAVELERQVLALVEAGHKDATVYINTKGGQTLEASEIVNILRIMPGKLNGIGGAIVASAGTYISSKLDSFEVAPNTQFMYHKPRGVVEGTHDEIQSQLKLLSNTEQDYLETYSAKTKKTKEVIKANWDKGDVWLMGQEIVNEGFADAMIAKPAKITAADVMILEACGAPVIPKVTSEAKPQKSKNREMKIDPLKIGLSADATDEQIEARIVDLKAKADSADALLKEKADKEAADKAKEINAILDQAIDDKKFTATLRDKFKGMLESDFENGKAIIAGLTGVPKISGEITDHKADAGERANWTFEDYQAKDPKALQEMHEKKPAEFNALFEKSQKS
jgi:ATP-dependent protease ClpP protease subunit